MVTVTYDLAWLEEFLTKSYLPKPRLDKPPAPVHEAKKCQSCGAPLTYNCVCEYCGTIH